MPIETGLDTDVMMQLGDFQFSIATAVYQELGRTTEHTWAAQQRFGQLDALQYTGPGSDTITLPGVIYPEYRGGLLQLSTMRVAAESAEPMLLLSGSGEIMGMWVIERVEERQKIFGAQGLPRKQEFTLSLRKFGDAAAELVEAIAATAALGNLAASTGDLKTAAGAVAGVKGLASRLLGMANGAIGSLTSSLANIKGIAGQLGAAAKSAMGAVQRGLDAAKGLKSLATGVLSQLKAIPTMLSAKACAANLVSGALKGLTQSTSASGVLKGITGNLMSSLTTPAQNIMATAQKNIGDLTNATRQAGTAASGLLSKLPF